MLDYDFDHIHYYNKCERWFVCSRPEFKCKLTSSIYLISHDEHVASISQTRSQG